MAAIFGAIVGGCIPIFAQFIAEHRTARKRDHATAIGLFFKLMDMHTSSAHLRSHLEEGAELAKTENTELSSTTLPIANPAQSISISIDEKAVIMSFNDHDLLNGILNLDRTFNAAISIAPKYEEMRSSVSEIIKGVPDRNGRAIVNITREQYVAIAAIRFQMDQLLASWLIYAQMDERSSKYALDLLALHIRRLYNPHFALEEISIVNAKL